MPNQYPLQSELIEQCFEYDPATGDISKEGRKVGAISDEYKVICFKNKSYGAHILAYIIYHGDDSIPDGCEIDHINGNKADNRIENLRAVTHQENSKNTKLYRNNTSGHPGVRKDNKAGYWRAFINKKQIGKFRTRKSAIAARKKAEQELGFHENHGRVRAA